MPAPFQERGEEMFRRSESFLLMTIWILSLLVKIATPSISRERMMLLSVMPTSVSWERHLNRKLTVHLPVVRRRRLTVDVRGRFGLELELYYKKPGRAAQIFLILPTACCLCLSLSARESIRMSAMLYIAR